MVICHIYGSIFLCDSVLLGRWAFFTWMSESRGQFIEHLTCHFSSKNSWEISKLLSLETYVHHKMTFMETFMWGIAIVLLLKMYWDMFLRIKTSIKLSIKTMPCINGLALELPQSWAKQSVHIKQAWQCVWPSNCYLTYSHVYLFCYRWAPQSLLDNG